MQEAVAHFLKTGYAELNCPETKNWIPTSLDLFVKLLNQPHFDKICFDDEGNPTHPDQEQTNIGLIYRTGKKGPDGTDYDHKIFYHTPAFTAMERILQKHNPQFLTQHRELIGYNRAFHAWCQKIIVEFAHELDRHTQNIINLAPKVGVEDDRLRTLAYTKLRDANTNEIGVAHFDKCGLTLALYESAPGLEFLINDRWIPISSTPGHPIIFAGLKLQQLTEGRIKAIKHRVRRVGDNRFNEQALRIAMVFFAHIEGIKVTLKTH